MRNSQVQLLMPQMGQVVKALIIASVATFLAQLAAEQWFDFPLSYYLGFVPVEQLRGWLWQPFTYAFLHSGVLHLVFNLLVIWSIGSELEERWGPRFFLTYFFVCTLGAAITYALFVIIGIGGHANLPVVGSSGAVYGLLLAYGLLFGERVLYFFMIFPMRAKYFVLILGAIVLVSTVFYGRDGVAHAAHLGGLLTGLAFLFGVAAYRRRQRPEYKRAKEDAARSRRVRSAQHLKVVRGGDEEGHDSGSGPKIWH